MVRYWTKTRRVTSASAQRKAVCGHDYKQRQEALYIELEIHSTRLLNMSIVGLLTKLENANRQNEQ